LIPFTLLTTGQLIATSLQRRPQIFRFILWAYIVVEIGVLTFLTMFHQRSWEVEQYLLETGRPIHSFYRLDRFDTPYYSWLHPAPGTPRTKIYAANRNPKFALLEQGQSLPSAFEGEITLCTKLVSEIRSGVMRPEYITMQEFDCDDGVGCFHLCKHAIETLADSSKPPMYKVDHIFNGDVTMRTTAKGPRLGFKERVLYKLDTALYTPF